MLEGARLRGGLRLQRDKILLHRSLRHSGAILKEPLGALFSQMGRQAARDAEADPPFGQRGEHLREAPCHVRNLDPQGHRPFAEVQAPHAVLKEVRVAAGFFLQRSQRGFCQRGRT